MNDCPGDDDINRRLLELLHADFCPARLVENHRAQGLLRSVNNGISAAGIAHDILILHPRTVPCAGFFEHLLTAATALDAEYIQWGAFSPLSDDCAFMGESSLTKDSLRLSRNASPDQVAALCSELFPVDEERTEISSTAPFCMLLNRTAIQRTGLLNEDFAPQFSGEIDWCLRAAKLKPGSPGFKHFLIPGIFVQHTGSSKFSTEDAALADEHEILLRTRHPENFKATKSPLGKNALLAYLRVLAPFCGVLNALQNARTAVHVLASRPGRDSGGISNYVFESAEDLRLRHHVSSVCIWPYQLGDSQFLGVSVDDESLPPLSAESLLRLIDLLSIKRFISVESFTLHQTKCWKKDNLQQLVDFFSLRTAKRNIIAHDYHFLCESKALSNRPFLSSASAIDASDAASCTLCIHAEPAGGERQDRLKILTKFNSIIFPSSAAKKLFEPILSESNLQQTISVPMTLHRQDFPESAASASIVRKINIVLFGDPAGREEAAACTELIHQLSERFNFVVLGESSLGADLPLRRIKLRAKRRTDLLSTLFELYPGFAVLSGDQREFSYALHEAVASRLPIITLAHNAEIAATIRRLAIGKVFGSMADFGQYLERGYSQLFEDIRNCRPSLASRINAEAIAEIYLNENETKTAQTQMQYQ